MNVFLQSPNNGKFIIWAAALVASFVASGLGLRALALAGVSLSASLATRGLVCAALVLVFARLRGDSLLPRRPETQFARAVLAGLALTIFSMSYCWLTASTVAILSNIDVPLMIVLGPVFGLAPGRKTRALALLAIVLLAVYVINLEQQEHLLYGLVTLFTGTLLLCFGYLFIKKSMGEENESVTILVPSLALALYALAVGALDATPSVPWTLPLFALTLISGSGMLVAYYATMRLYEQTDLATAEFPTLIASIAIQPVEYFFLRTPLAPSYFILSAVFVAATALILKLQNREVAHA